MSILQLPYWDRWTFTFRKLSSPSKRFDLFKLTHKSSHLWLTPCLFSFLASTTLSSFNLTYEIFKSSLDLALNSNKEFWLDITHALWKVYMSPFEIKKDYHYPCSWLEAITGEYTSIYFTQLWTQVIWY